MALVNRFRVTHYYFLSDCHDMASSKSDHRVTTEDTCGALSDPSLKVASGRLAAEVQRMTHRDY